MPRSFQNLPDTCPACGHGPVELIRGLCIECYGNEERRCLQGPICECCGIGDLRVLGRTRLNPEHIPLLCANCEAIAGGRSMSLNQLKADVFPAGDRRQGDRRLCRDRRFGSRRRISCRNQEDAPSPERRKGDRRRMG